MRYRQEIGSIAVHVSKSPLRITRGRALAVPDDPMLILDEKQVDLNGFRASLSTAKAERMKAESSMVSDYIVVEPCSRSASSAALDSTLDGTYGLQRSRGNRGI